MQDLGGAREVLQARAFEKNLQAIRVHRTKYKIFRPAIKDINNRIEKLYWTSPPPEDKKFFLARSRTSPKEGPSIMLVIDLDSHSRPRSEDYVIAPQYEHLRPRSFTDASGNVQRVFNNKVVSVLTAGEREISSREGKAAWGAAEYDADVRYEQVKAAGIDYQFVSAGTVGMFSYIDPDQIGRAS